MKVLPFYFIGEEMNQETDLNSVIVQYAKPEVSVELTTDAGNTVTFRIMHWTPSKVFNRLPEYGSVLAVPMVMYSTAEEFATQEDYEQKIAMALIQLFSGLEQRVLADFLKSILDEVYTASGDSVSENFDAIFIKHPYLVIELASKVLEVNYGPFFKRGFGGILSQLQGIKTLNEK